MTTQSASGPRPPLTIQEFAKVMGVSRATAYRQLADGTLPVRTIKIGRQHRVPRAELDRLLGEGGAAS